MNIAIVDDNTTVLTTYYLSIKSTINEGDNFDKFTMGSMFLEFIKNNGINYYDVVIMDNNLDNENMNGFDILMEMQNIGYTGEAILLTGDDSFTLGQKMQLSASVHYVEKQLGQFGISEIKKIIKQKGWHGN